MSRVYRCWLLLGAAGFLGALPGCGPATPLSYSLTLDKVEVEPAAVTTETAVALKFKVTCVRTAGHNQVPFTDVEAEARSAGRPVGTVRVRCKAVQGQHYAANPWEGAGVLKVGKRPAGRHELVLTFRPVHAGGAWAMPDPAVITVEVREAAR